MIHLRGQLRAEWETEPITKEISTYAGAHEWQGNMNPRSIAHLCFVEWKTTTDLGTGSTEDITYHRVGHDRHRGIWYPAEGETKWGDTLTFGRDLSRL